MLGQVPAEGGGGWNMGHFSRGGCCWKGLFFTASNLLFHLFLGCFPRKNRIARPFFQLLSYIIKLRGFAIWPECPSHHKYRHMRTPLALARSTSLEQIAFICSRLTLFCPKREQIK